MSRTNKLFMAVAKGKVSSEGGDIKRYIGELLIVILKISMLLNNIVFIK